MIYKLLVFISGEGTNLEAIIDACEHQILNASVVAVLSNKKTAFGLIRAKNHNINTHYRPYLRTKINRDDYDRSLANYINKIDYDLIILAGWMHVLGHEFLSNICKSVINLHPALPGQFPGIDAIKYAYDEFKLNKIKMTGIMVHHVVEEIDAGEVIETMNIPILENDTEDSLRKRIRYFEKSLFIYALLKELNIKTKCNKFSEESCYTKMDEKKFYQGKVRDIYNIHKKLMVMVISNRQSAFNRHICNIKGKGKILTNVSAWWFRQTKHIIDNHYIYHDDNIMIVKKCIPYKIEVVVRGYMTGNTETAIWTHYKNGERQYCGYNLEEGYIKNQILKYNIVTPTTKDISDRPISGEEVIALGLMNEIEWEYMKEISLKLFKYGQNIVANKDLILVDTKYEFGKDYNGKIILIDEIHTCDSSRYWLKKTYQEKFNKGLEPDKFDKDIIRDWIKNKSNQK